ncbi:MAG: hypothetical protein ACETVZ_01955 [Phycisphaerae bacterium]
MKQDLQSQPTVGCQGIYDTGGILFGRAFLFLGTLDFWKDSTSFCMTFPKACLPRRARCPSRRARRVEPPARQVSDAAGGASRRVAGTAGCSHETKLVGVGFRVVEFSLFSG